MRFQVVTKLFVCLLCFLKVGNLYAITADHTLAERLAAMQDYYYEFTQDLLDANGRILQTNLGELYIKKPGWLRWHIKEPDEILVIFDGIKVWHYDILLEQVTVQTQQHLENASIQALLMGDIEALNQDFTIKQSKPSQCLDISEECFMLSPRVTSNHLPFQSVKIGFLKHQLIAMQVVDQLDQVSNFKFRSIASSKDISEDLFRFTAPDGVDIIGDEN